MKIFIFLLVILSLFTACSVQDKPILTNLNENWELQYPEKDTVFNSIVPNSVHTDLLNGGAIEDPFYRTNEASQQWIDKKDWLYQLTFDVTDEILEKQNINLIFEGLDTYAEIYLNDSLVLSTDNMFIDWTVDCRGMLKPFGNTLSVKLKSPINEGLKKLDELGYPLPASNDQSQIGGLGNKQVSIFTRKAPYHYGWDWGPRFVTLGIWKPVYLKAWNSAIINNVHITIDEIKTDTAEINVSIIIESNIEQSIDCELKLDNGHQLSTDTYNLVIGENSFTKKVSITDPKIWWPNGSGKQPLYKLAVKITSENTELDSKETTFGIRTVQLVQDKDSIGTSFYFNINGRPIFMKGANYIPSDVFLNRVKEEDYRNIIKSAVDANMNMLRVWGGGIYEKDIFYDLCDEYGLLVWQDFMFACSMYPGDAEFLENVKQEAIQNVIRLRNHPSIVLWCGNNEIIDAWNRWGWKKEYAANADEIWKAYEDIFYDVLPSVVNEYDSTRYYWPSSASSEYNAPSELHSGDYHYWGVWHGMEPFEKFDTNIGRFMSEYGFQSFPEFSTVKKYTLPEDWDIESNVMKSHQRSGIGNLRIRDYTDMYFKQPKNFEMQLYVGQLLQAYGIEKAIKTHRRNKPYCMGTLYWQLNDCWPVASWSSTDYYRNWKALHYAVKNSFENILIAPFQSEDSLEVFIVSDLFDTINGRLNLSLLNFAGDEIFKQEFDVFVEANSSKKYFSININEYLAESERTNSLLKINLLMNDEIISAVTHYFVPPKELELEKANIKISIHGDNELKITSNKFAKNVFIEYRASENFHFSDNYFDLLPGEEKIIAVGSDLTSVQLKKIKAISLVNSYNN